jgi:hypothetical protein
MFQNWGGGFTDYGGCFGAGNLAGNTAGTNGNRTMYYGTNPTSAMGALGDNVGMFYGNSSIRTSDIRDGTSSTIMIGEVQRLNGGTQTTTSIDGWAVGGMPTLFSTFESSTLPTSVQSRGGINGLQRETAGSDHRGGAHFGMADGTVRFLSENMDMPLYTALGTIGKREVVNGL